jgi:hypothetical protein
MDNRRDELDRLIDGGLASYADAEPLAGIEARVLNRVRVARNRRRWLAWGLGLAVAASVVVGAVSWSGQKTVSKKTPVALVTGLGPQAVSREMAVANIHRAGTRAKRANRPRALPKLEQFPTPTPSTVEERALVAFVQRNPQVARQVFADLQKRSEEPIDIQPIEIAPLQKDGE